LIQGWSSQSPSAVPTTPVLEIAMYVSSRFKIGHRRPQITSFPIYYELAPLDKEDQETFLLICGLHG